MNRFSMSSRDRSCQQSCAFAVARAQPRISPPLDKGGLGGSRSLHLNAEISVRRESAANFSGKNDSAIGSVTSDPPNPPLLRGGEKRHRILHPCASSLATVLLILIAAPLHAQEVHLYKAARIWSATGPAIANGGLLV